MEWLRYNNQGAIRSKPISPKLARALSFLPELGVEMEVFSGGQAPKGSGGPRTGSTRHDHGNAADVYFYKDGQRLDWSNPDHLPIFKEVVQRAKANGVTGFGAGEGYMRPGSMHIGFGNEAIWGAGGSGENAAPWLREAYHGEPGHIHRPGDENQGIADATMTALGKQPIRQTSLLGGEGNDKLEAPMAPEQQRGLLFGMLPEKAQAYMTPERVAKLQMALEGATLNPNRGIVESAKATIQQAGDAKQRNKTAEWLAQNGRDDLAQAVASGAIDGRTAVAEAMKKPDPTADLKVINGQLVNIRTNEVVGDYRTPKGEDEAEYGLTPQYITREDGTLGMIQLGKDGSVNEVDLPEGAALQKGVEKLDLGTSYQWYNTVTGQPIGQPIPKDSRGEAREKAIGTTEGNNQAEAVAGAPKAIEQAEQGIALIDSIVSDPSLPGITGMIQGRMPPMTQAGTDLNEKLNQLKGKAFLEAFESLKGGGQITEREGQAAQAAMARLNRAQSDQAYIAALLELRGIMAKARARAQQATGQNPAEGGGWQTVDGVRIREKP